MRDGQQIAVEDLLTITSPVGNKYHGDHVSLRHNIYTISVGGHHDFRSEPLVRGFPEEIRQAFEIANYINWLGEIKTKEILEKYNK